MKAIDWINVLGWLCVAVYVGLFWGWVFRIF